MRELFSDIVNIEVVKGLMWFYFAGDNLFKEFHSVLEDLENRNWGQFSESLAGMRDTDLIFEKRSALYSKN